MRIAPSLHRLGEDLVNCYLVEEAGEVTLIDAGVPAYYRDLVDKLATMGRTIDDVRAVVLTHGHSDHVGFAEQIRDEHGVPVSVHELDAALARGEAPNPSAGMGERKLGSLLSLLLRGMRRGALRAKPLTEVGTFGAGTALHAAGLDALFVGDTLSTLAVTTGHEGPQVPPFSADSDAALDSLTEIEAVDAAWLLPGHDAPWTDGVAAAVAAARETGVDHLARPGG